MKVKCEYCGGMMDDTLEKCPNCGGKNRNIHQTVDGTPKTIEELEAWYKARKLPPYETTRFFIGINYQEPKAFGIYKEGNEFIVYKNKDTGERVIRYRGTDEAYAVNELYLKLKSEILNQKERNVGKKRKRSKEEKRADRKATLFLILLVVGAMLAFGLFIVALEFLDSLFRGFGDAIMWGMLGVPIMFLLQMYISYKFLPEHIADKIDNAKHNIAIRVIVAVAMWFVVALPLFHMHNTADYYIGKDNRIYAEYRHDWYYYDVDSDNYFPSKEPTNVESVSTDSLYNSVDDWNESSFTEFEDCRSYDTYYPSSSSDSDYDWDSGSSWDSGGTDWSSDW
ncbi:MAG: hypothetical protein PUB19_00645 [Lachnospiraceae bacterium]|nr:hypothetical protein [Lachnospiraceae bacterium]